MLRRPLAIVIAAFALVMTSAPMPSAEAALPPGGTFVDDNGNTHEGYIEAIAAAGITKGCNPPSNNRFCPSDKVDRGQLAALLRRALNLRSSSRDYFVDDDRSMFEADINALAAAGITKGCNPPSNNRFCPSDEVDRGQLAALLRRALNLRSSSRDYFVDDDRSTFEADINALAARGITRGCNPPNNNRFCPTRDLERDEVATFIGKAMGLRSIAVPPPNGSSPGGDLSGVFWSADYENGRTNQWDNVAISGNGDSNIVSGTVHSGNFANALTINAGNSKSGVRMVFKNAANSRESDNANIPNEAYYSAWYYIPTNFTADWNNIHQWKQQAGGTARFLYGATLYNTGNGGLTITLASNVTSSGQWQNSNARTWPSGVQVPVGRWFHLESFYRWSENGNGRVTSWLDGRQLWDVTGVTTEFDWSHQSYKRQWTVNNYANDTNPSTLTIYVDDAAVSTTRVGP